MKIDGRSILVTGGAGLIGSSTIDQLLHDHHPARIVILDNLVRGSLDNVREALRDPRVHFVRGDICDAAAVDQAMTGMDAVIHLAALRITECAAEPRRGFEVMCDGTFNVIDAARQHEVERIVAASSASIYGMATSFPTSEDHHPYGNRTLYGAGKTLLEGLLRSYREMGGAPYVAMRYFNVYGPRMDRIGKYTEVLVRWMERITAGEPPIIMGDGSQTMDFVYIDDVARANVFALASDVDDEVFNVASGAETSLLELATALLDVMDSDLQPVFAPERGVNAVRRRLADTSKAERLLGFRARVGLHEGLARLVEWWRHGGAEFLAGTASPAAGAAHDASAPGGAKSGTVRA
jgi:UDP-glucose 4-epimerase